MPSICPVCEDTFHVSKLTCKNCESELHGTFELNEFASLNKEKLDFLRLYLISRGNLTKVASKLKISYPTALDRFTKLLEDLFKDNEDYSESSNLSGLSQKNIDQLLKKSEDIRKDYTKNILNKFISNEMTEEETAEKILKVTGSDTLSQKEIDELIILLKIIKKGGEKNVNH